MLWHFLGHTRRDKQQHELEKMVAPGLHTCNLRKRRFRSAKIKQRVKTKTTTLHYSKHDLLYQELKEGNPIYKHAKLVLSSGMAHLVL